MCGEGIRIVRVGKSWDESGRGEWSVGVETTRRKHSNSNIFFLD